MKKIAIYVMMIIAAIICSFTFVACSDNDVSASSDAATLVMDKHYINADYVNEDTEKQIYYVFHADGTGEFIYHYDFSGSYYESHYHYIIHFKYTYVDNDKSAVVCFYDSIERLDGDDKTYNSTSWSSLVTVSKNVLTTVGSGYTFWISEDYLKNLTHFGK